MTTFHTKSNIAQGKTCKKGDRFFCRVLLKDSEDKVSAKGAAYQLVRLSDSTGSLDIFLFSDGAEFRNATQEDSPVLFDILFGVGSYRDKPSYEIIQLARVPASEVTDATLSEYLEKSPVPLSQLKLEFDSAIRSLGPDLKQIVQKLLDEKFKGFDIWPAASSVHHDYVHGLLEHTVRMLRQARVLCPLYDVDKDVVTAAIILHDAAKTIEYRGPGKLGKTLLGHTHGHIYLAAANFRLYAEAYLENLRAANTQAADYGCDGLHMENRWDFLNVEHCILSHHGKREYGAIALPLTKEAILVHNIDSADSHLCGLSRHTVDLSPGEMTKDSLLVLDRNPGVVLSPVRRPTPPPIK